MARAAGDAGLDGSAIVAQASAPEAKAAVRRATEDAIAAGAFGVPSMFVNDELFWGVDSLPHLERFLRGERAVDARAIERWERVAPSATRKGGA